MSQFNQSEYDIAPTPPEPVAVFAHDKDWPPNPEQAEAIEGLYQFMAKAPPGRTMTLSGSAGTGKTFCMRKVREALGQRKPNMPGEIIPNLSRYIFSAPTNKAARVLSATIGAQAITTYSALGLQMMANGEVKEVSKREYGEKPIQNARGLVVDEGSMVNTVLMQHIDDAAAEYGIPVIFLGDQYQLNPVGEEISPLWKRQIDFDLQQVMRFDNQILKLATQLREYSKNPFRNLDLKADNANGEGVWKTNKQAMMQRAMQMAAAGDFQAGTAKAIAWRNATVDKMNEIIRSAIPDRDFNLPFSKGDRVVAREPCLGYDGKPVLHTDDECTVMEVVVGSHPKHPEYECFLLDLATPDNRKAAVWIPTPRAAPFLKAELKRLSDVAKKNPKQWRAFWSLKESFHNIALAYAITAHRSQGSTYQETFVDFGDILSNPTRPEGAKCLYVACSRAQKQLWLGS